MKIKCEKQILLKALNTVYKAVTNRTTIPILKGILIETIDQNHIHLTASDLDISIEKKCEAEVLEQGSIVVSSKLFIEIIRKLPDSEIEIEEKDTTVTIRCKSSEFTIVGQPSYEFPNISEVNELNRMVFDKEIFRKMIRRTSFAASTDESRGVLTGVLIEVNEKDFSMVALDGFRMAIARENISSEKPVSIVISAKIINEINKILSEEENEDDFVLILDEKKAVIIIGKTKITSRLLEGDYINYKDIIPKTNQCLVKTDRRKFMDGIDRASLIVREGKNNLIKMVLKDQKAVITSRSEEGNVKEEIEMEMTGEGLEIGFNSKYITDVLKACEEETILMEFNTNITPCLIKPEEGNDFEYLILPVRISSN